jgi:hypothetical protein
MIVPTRIRLSRHRGFRLQALSRAINGLPAVSIAPGTHWENHFFVGQRLMTGITRGEIELRLVDVLLAVELYRRYAESQPRENPAYLDNLRGRNLACWCGHGQPCHGTASSTLALSPSLICGRAGAP